MVKQGKANADALSMRVGELTLEQINLLMTNIPVEITFADEDDIIRFYSGTKEHIFGRSPDIIGRTVQDCHPAKSHDVVNRMLKEFKSGAKDLAEFWFEKDGRLIYIRYFPIREENGEYCGVAEVTQDVTHIRDLKGEQHTLDW